MKLIVSNEHEKEAMTKLFEALHDSCMEDIFETLQSSYKVTYDELVFLQQAVFECNVLIDKKEIEISIDTELIGKCSKCGCDTYGTIDGNLPTLRELKDAQDKAETWLCEDCYFKEDE